MTYIGQNRELMMSIDIGLTQVVQVEASNVSQPKEYHLPEPLSAYGEILDLAATPHDPGLQLGERWGRVVVRPTQNNSQQSTGGGK